MRFEYASKSGRCFNLPTRGTAGSAGYDFHSPAAYVIQPGQSMTINLEVKCKLDKGYVLLIVPRSSMGFKNGNHMTLTNTVGVIDSDYYDNKDNEGCIAVRLHNFGEKPYVIIQNDKVCQGIIVPYAIVENDHATDIRNGGFGSTGK